MIRKEGRRLRIGVLGAGPIAQFAHLEACVKARNADLYAICDAAPELLARMAAVHAPVRSDGRRRTRGSTGRAMNGFTCQAEHVAALRAAVDALLGELGIIGPPT